MSHSHNTEDTRGLKIGIVLNGLYAVVGLVAGLLTGSLTLITDAIHNLTDNFTLSVSYAANRIAKRQADSDRTFGYGRATILAALINASFMIAVALFVAVEAIQRLSDPVAVEGGVVALVASIGIFVNVFIAYSLSKNRKDLNMRSAYIDQLFDALSSFGAVSAGLLIYFTDIQYIDSIFALLIVGLLLYNTIKILKEAVHILLEGTPKDTDIETIVKIIEAHPKVIQTDDLHVWAIRSGYNAVSCHIVIAQSKLSESRSIVEAVKKSLQTNCNIHHSTIEVEFEESTKNKAHENH
ncbi:cation transporter [Candidatus Saccharibacteria bacterium]|nr:cation transporter [Candidatus Saccharibacteria bacterium]MCA9328808.1 cation transporter [Candidatus Saccharibacteria bacterium]